MCPKIMFTEYHWPDIIIWLRHLIDDRQKSLPMSVPNSAGSNTIASFRG